MQSVERATRGCLIAYTGGLAALVAATFSACTERERSVDKKNYVASQPWTRPVRQYCFAGAGAPIRISEDSVGLLDLGMKLGSLKAACRAAYDDVSYGEETVSPGVVFPFDSLTAVAIQHEDSLRPNQPADAWSVSGANGLLFGRIRLTAPWADFRDAFGPGIARGENISIGENRVTVMFCAHPRVLLILDASPDSIAPDRPADLSRIPARAKVKEVEIFPRPNPTWQC